MLGPPMRIFYKNSDKGRIHAEDEPQKLRAPALPSNAEPPPDYFYNYTDLGLVSGSAWHKKGRGKKPFRLTFFVPLLFPLDDNRHRMYFSTG